MLLILQLSIGVYDFDEARILFEKPIGELKWELESFSLFGICRSNFVVLEI